MAVIFRAYGLAEETVQTVVAAIRRRPRPLGRFHDAFRAGSRGARSTPGAHQRADDSGFVRGRRIDPARALFRLAGGSAGLLASIVLTLMALGIFGYIKGRFTVRTPWRSAWQTMAVGARAAGAAFALAKWIA